MNYESWISYRYLTSKHDKFLSLINLVSIVGVAIGVMALIVVIGVMTGFDNKIKEKIIGTNSHIVIEKETGLQNYRLIQEQILNVEGILGTTPYIHGNVFLEFNGQARAITLRGIDPETASTVTEIKGYLKEGKLDDLQEKGIIVGSQLASYYGYNLGDVITLIAPASGVAGQGWRYNLKITGIFTSGMYDYDMNFGLIHLHTAQEIFDLPRNISTGIAVKLDDVYKATEVKQEIYNIIGYSYLVRTWIESNKNFFAALRLEKFAMFVILTLIVLVASFNIISTLIVTVTSKIKDIGILKSLGVPSRSIKRIFTMEGIAIGLLGMFWGLFGGVSLVFLLKKYQFVKVPQEIYYIDRLPIELQLSDILIIFASVVVISYLATIYPAMKAANLEPVEALRYE